MQEKDKSARAQMTGVTAIPVEDAKLRFQFRVETGFQRAIIIVEKLVPSEAPIHPIVVAMGLEKYCQHLSRYFAKIFADAPDDGEVNIERSATDMDFDASMMVTSDMDACDCSKCTAIRAAIRAQGGEPDTAEGVVH